MSRFHLEVLEPTSLVASGGSTREGFEAVWRLLGGDASPWWHRSRRLDADGGLFLKGLHIGAVGNPQHFLRRWHILNEARNLRALHPLDLAIPVALAWGWETRFGLPVRSFLLQRAIEAAIDFEAYIRAGGASEERLPVFRAVGESVRRLHAAGWIHGDLACRNLMVRPAAHEVVLVDLARVKPTRPDRIGWRRRKELYRLVKSADKCGAAVEEVDAMLRGAAGDDARDIVHATRELRAISRRAPRKLHTWYWRITGRNAR